MDYEKKYKEALNLAKSYYEKEDGGANQFLDTIFPELRESEDERIRKEIIEFFRSAANGQTKVISGANSLMWADWLEKQKEQKPEKKQDYSELSELERAIHRGFLAAGVENVPVGIIKETAQECLAQMKPAEWSEEDEKQIAQIERIVKNAGCAKMLQDKIHNWFKSLRPSWNPGEEQMKNFPKWKKADRDWDAGTIDFVVFHKNDGGDHEDWLSVEVTNRLYKGEYYIELSDLDKLPKEE